MALARRPRARHRLDPRRPRGHDRRRDRRAPHREGRARHLATGQLGLAGTIYVARRRQRRALLGPPDRSLRAQEAVPDHARASTSWRRSRPPSPAASLFFAICRFFTGFGIGGEYAAINSAIDELIPARVRGWVDLAINGSYWLGAAFGAAVTPILLNPDLLDADVGWRLTFALGAVLGARHPAGAPQRAGEPALADRCTAANEEAERIVGEIEEHVKEATGRDELPEARDEIELRPRERTGFGEIARTMFGKLPEALVPRLHADVDAGVHLQRHRLHVHGRPRDLLRCQSETAPLYLVPFAIANFLGALLLGRFFDTIGRRPMIAATYFDLGGGARGRRRSVQERLACPWACSWRSCARRSSSRRPPRRPAT